MFKGLTPSDDELKEEINLALAVLKNDKVDGYDSSMSLTNLSYESDHKVNINTDQE